MESPAPTALRGRSTVAEPKVAPVASTSTAPSAPRLARTAPTPRPRSSSAAATTSPSVSSWRPVASASSSRFGLIRSGPASSAATRGAPLESMATLTVVPPSRSTTRA